MSNTIYFVYCKLDVVGGITEGIMNYPQNYTPNSAEKLQCLQMLKSEKLNH